MELAPESRPFDDVRNLVSSAPGMDTTARDQAQKRQQEIAQPSGELGRLSELAVWLAAWQGRDPASVINPQVVVFAASHGVMASEVSAYGVAETQRKLSDLTSGKGAVNQIAGTQGCGLKVVELAPEVPTGDITREPAMSEPECAATIAYGMEAVADKPDVLGLGAVGAGATTAAGAVAYALFGGSPSFWAVSGSAAQKPDLLVGKAAAIDAAVSLNSGNLSDPLEVLRLLGGRDLAAIMGAIIAARHERIPVVLDGFVATTAAALLHCMSPKMVDHCMVGAVTSRDSHHALLGRIGLKPLLELGMGLGDGSGAALAIGIARSAVACHIGIGRGQP